MLISHKWLKTYFKNPEILPSPEAIADLFTMHAFEIESLEKKGDDTIYDIKITADRSSYAYGLRYVALELSMIIPELVIEEHIRFDLTNEDLSHIKTKVNHELVNTFLHPLCPIYSLTKIENISNVESPDFIKEGLIAIGQNPKSLLVDLTNFIMFDTGQPLHVFDADKVDGNIKVDLSKVGESITILGGKEIPLEENTLVIRDYSGILAIAGVKGGIKAEVDSDTKNVYLESANFNPTTVRKTARKLNLINESSKRFEQGLNKERTLLALSDYLHLLTWYGKDIVVHDTQISDEIDHIYNFENRRHIEINIDNLVRYINKNDNELKNYIKDFIQNILPKTGAQVINKEDDNYTIIVPYHRSDMVLDVDIADEYLRNKNYDILTYNEDFKNNSFHSNISKSDTDEKIYKIRKYFMNKGFDEVILHTLVDSKKDTDATILENSLTIDRNALRSNLKNNIIQSVENNFKHLDLVSKNIIKVFEIGNVFVDKENDVEEKTHLAFALAMAKWPKGISGEESIKEIISDLDLKNVKIELVNNIVIAEVDINENDFSNLESEKVESYMSGDAMIKNLKYKKASSYPAMSRDIAFFVDDSLEKNEDDIEKIIKDFVTKNPIIENHFRFDIFKKDGKTSYAYRFVFQSYEKTLTEEETKEVMLKLGKELVTLGFEVR